MIEILLILILISLWLIINLLRNFINTEDLLREIADKQRIFAEYISRHQRKEMEKTLATTKKNLKELVKEANKRK